MRHGIVRQAPSHSLISRTARPRMRPPPSHIASSQLPGDPPCAACGYLTTKRLLGVLTSGLRWASALMETKPSSPGADVGGVSPVPVQMAATGGTAEALAHMRWHECCPGACAGTKGAHPTPHLRRDRAHPTPHLRRDRAHPTTCHILPGTLITLATSAVPHICAGTGLTPTTSAPGLGKPCHIRPGTWLITSTALASAHSRQHAHARAQTCERWPASGRARAPGATRAVASAARLRQARAAARWTRERPS